MLDPSERYVLAGFGSARSEALGVVRLSIGPVYLRHGHYELQYVVVEDEVMSLCVIFGIDFLSAHDISLDFRRDGYRQSGQLLPGHSIAEVSEPCMNYIA